MSAELWILVATAVLAVVAICAAVIAVRAARRVTPLPQAPADTVVAQPSTELAVLEPMPQADHVRSSSRGSSRAAWSCPRSQQQVVNTALGRPGVRLSVFAHGLAHALRAESRDRITAMMRREYRRRRRERLQAGRRAVRAGRPTPPSDEWLGSW